MIFTYDFKDGAYYSIEEGQVTFWLGEGLPNFKGKLSDFAEAFPIYTLELLNKGFIRES